MINHLDFSHRNSRRIAEVFEFPSSEKNEKKMKKKVLKNIEKSFKK